MNLINLLNAIKGYNHIIISGHIRPDGDCIGSCYALASVLDKHKFKVNVALEDVSDTYDFLAGKEYLISKIPNNTENIVFIALDCGDKARLGPFEDDFDKAELTINIDHHISNTKYARYNHVMNVSSTCEIIYEMINNDYNIDKDIAMSLYTGIIYDTGAFKHSNTTYRTHEIAGELIKHKFDYTEIINTLFNYRNYNSLKILGEAINNCKQFNDGKIIISSLNIAEMNNLNGTKHDTEGIVQILNEVISSETAVFIYQTENNNFKVSLRAKEHVNVCKVAKTFGGGGHIKAAGCSMTGNLEDIVQSIVHEISKQL